MKETLTATDFYFGIMLVLLAMDSILPTIICAILAGYGFIKELNHD